MTILVIAMYVIAAITVINILCVPFVIGKPRPVFTPTYSAFVIAYSALLVIVLVAAARTIS